MSADIIRKAIVFPEHAEASEPPVGVGYARTVEKRNYPKVLELLAVNPFAKPKKGKKGKKGKKK